MRLFCPGRSRWVVAKRNLESGSEIDEEGEAQEEAGSSSGKGSKLALVPAMKLDKWERASSPGVRGKGRF